MIEAYLVKYGALALAFLIAVIGHEIMHGAVAKYYGDNTAKDAGRLTINPIKHIDLVGSIIFPVSLYLIQELSGVKDPVIFGWAKPVPVNMFKVVENGGYIAAVWVSLAGVIFNIFLALIASSLFYLFINPDTIFSAFMFLFLYYLILVNVILFVFNLLPLPPLDGANAIKFLSLHLKWYKIVEFYNKIEPYGMLILMIVLFTPLSKIIFYPVTLLLKILL